METRLNGSNIFLTRIPKVKSRRNREAIWRNNGQEFLALKKMRVFKIKSKIRGIEITRLAVMTMQNQEYRESIEDIRKEINYSQILISNNGSQKKLEWHFSLLKGQNCHLELHIYKSSVTSYGKINTFWYLQNRKLTTHTFSLKELLNTIF